MKWIQYPLADESVVHTLMQQGKNLHPALARVLALRGIDSKEKATRFFREKLEKLADLPDPLLMHDMETGAKRLARAVRGGEFVVVYGDFDVDGMSSVALLKTFLDKYHARSEYFVPNRFKDGYGLGPRGITFAAEQGASLLVAVDCGITGVMEAADAKAQGLDLIICDHHLPSSDLPDAVAVIDPKIALCPYPFKELSACGIAFKLAQATAAELGEYPGALSDLLAFVALSTVADMVPLREENRVLVRAGLDVIRATRHPGLRALASVAKIDLQHAKASDIAWRLAPRLNAAGRMEDASLAIDLLLADDPYEARKLATKLERLNQTRRARTDELYVAAKKQASIQVSGQHDGALVLHDYEWHAGILGLAASRIAREFLRPAIALTVTGETASGSARTFGSIDIHDALTECSDLLIGFGGHAAAAGLRLHIDNIAALRQRLSKYVKDRLTPEDFEARIHFDAVLSLSDIDSHFEYVVQHLQPCGMGNEAPLFVGHDLVATSVNKLKNGHLRFAARQADDRRSAVHKVIAFNLGHRYNDLTNGQSFDMLFAIEQNRFQGTTTTQLNAKDLRPPHRVDP